MNGSTRYQRGRQVMTARSDGQLSSREAVVLPIMAPRLQADFYPDGIIRLALWAAGTLGTVSFTPLAGPFTYAPNRVVGKTGSVHVAQSRPVMVICGAKAKRAAPAKRAAWWHQVASGQRRAKVTRKGAIRTFELGWGVFALEQRNNDLVLAVGASVGEAHAALAMTVEAIIAEAQSYSLICDRLPDGDPILRSLVSQGTHAALSSIRQDENGDFAGLSAGQAYSAPARTYFRDGYWTLQPLLHLAPEIVRDQIRLLATGIQPDGEAPSGVILSGPAQSAAWERFRQRAERYRDEHLRPGDWWSDHFDSPLFFVLALGDYVAATGDVDEARRHWLAVTAILERYVRACGPEGLPKKPNHDRDWADNVYREGFVSYDIGLWIGALDAIARVGASFDPATAARARRLAATARANIDRVLWVGRTGNFADFVNSDGFVEDHFMIDSLTLLRYDAVSEVRAGMLLGRAEALLESRNNKAQPYGDWRALRVSTLQASARRPIQVGICLSLSQRLGLALLGRRLCRGETAPWPAGGALRADPLVGGVPGQWLGRRGGILLAALRAGIAAPGLERTAGARRNDLSRRAHVR